MVKMKKGLSKIIVFAIAFSIIFTYTAMAATIYDVLPEDILIINNKGWNIDYLFGESSEKATTEINDWAGQQGETLNVYYRLKAAQGDDTFYDAFNTTNSDSGEPLTEAQLKDLEAMASITIVDAQGKAEVYTLSDSEEIAVQGINSTGNKKVEVTFNKSLQAADYDKAKFAFDNSLSVESAALKSGSDKTVELITSSQDSAKTYTLTYNGTSTGKSFVGIAGNVPDAPVVVVDPVTGEVTGLDSSKKYEYQKEGDTTWTEYDPSNPPQGTVLIREAAQNGNPAGVSVEVTFKEITNDGEAVITKVEAISGIGYETVTMTFDKELTVLPTVADLKVSREINDVLDTTELTVANVGFGANRSIVTFNVAPKIVSGDLDKSVKYTVEYKNKKVEQEIEFIVPQKIEYIKDYKVEYIGFLKPFYSITINTVSEVDNARIVVGTTEKDMNYDGGNQFVFSTSTVTEGDVVTVKVYDNDNILKQEKKITIEK